MPTVTVHVVAPIEASRWVAVWGERWEREAYFDNHTLADAYAIAHRGPGGDCGRVVRMAALDPWPCAGDSSQHGAFSAM